MKILSGDLIDIDSESVFNSENVNKIEIPKEIINYINSNINWSKKYNLRHSIKAKKAIEKKIDDAIEEFLEVITTCENIKIAKMNKCHDVNNKALYYDYSFLLYTNRGILNNSINLQDICILYETNFVKNPYLKVIYNSRLNKGCVEDLKRMFSEFMIHIFYNEDIMHYVKF